MIDISKFIKKHTPLCICTLGIAVLGYMGYHAVRWIINKCFQTEKIDRISREIINSSQTEVPSSQGSIHDHWWTKITESNEFHKYKKNWKNLAKSEDAREREAKKLQSSYLQHANSNDMNQSTYNAPLGTVYAVPGKFNLWMPGVALVASYLTEKKKIEGLYVCKNLESLSNRLNEINSTPSDQRYAFIVGTFSSGVKNFVPFGFEPNFPQHKATVCVEKRDGRLSIALLDAMPEKSNKEIKTEHLKGKIWDGYDKANAFNAQELVFRAILEGCRNSQYPVRFLHSQVLREKILGCEVFALQDAIAYLRDPNFFDKITCSKEKVQIDQQHQIEKIISLPPEYMVGAQSTQIINDYKGNGGKFDTVLPGKKKTLQDYLDANLIEVNDKSHIKKKQNHYITKKSFKYLNFAVLSLNSLNTQEIENIINKTLIG